MAQTLAQILSGTAGNPWEPNAPGGGMSPLVQMLMQARQGQPPAQPPPMGMGQGQAGGDPSMMQLPAAAGLGVGGIPQQNVPGQPVLPGLGSLAQPWPAGVAAGGLY
jgi:hypothetical protein